MSKNKSYLKWCGVISKKIEWFNAPWTENEIIYFRKSIGWCGLKDQSLRESLLNQFESKMPEGGYNIMPDHSNKGIEYLKKISFKLNGGVRKNCPFGSFERDVIKTFIGFKFVGLHPQRNGVGKVLGYLPIYRCISENGSSFDYVGGELNYIEVLNINTTILKVV